MTSETLSPAQQAALDNDGGEFAPHTNSGLLSDHSWVRFTDGDGREAPIDISVYWSTVVPGQLVVHIETGIEFEPDERNFRVDLNHDTIFERNGANL